MAVAIVDAIILEEIVLECRPELDDMFNEQEVQAYCTSVRPVIDGLIEAMQKAHTPIQQQAMRLFLSRSVEAL